MTLVALVDQVHGGDGNHGLVVGALHYTVEVALNLDKIVFDPGGIG